MSKTKKSGQLQVEVPIEGGSFKYLPYARGYLKASEKPSEVGNWIHFCQPKGTYVSTTEGHPCYFCRQPVEKAPTYPSTWVHYCGALRQLISLERGKKCETCGAY